VVPSHVSSRSIDISGLGDNLEAALGLENLPQTATHYRMIVGDHNPD
jgi:hypothetical protein